MPSPRPGLLAFFLAGALMGVARSAPAQDVPGRRDHPVVSRYPGSKITQYKAKDFDEIDIPLARAKEDP